MEGVTGAETGGGGVLSDGARRSLEAVAPHVAVFARVAPAAGTEGDDDPEFNGYAAHQSRVESVDRRGSIVRSGGADARVVWADVEADHDFLGVLWG